MNPIKRAIPKLKDRCSYCNNKRSWHSSIIAFNKVYHFCSEKCETRFKEQEFSLQDRN